MLHQYRIFIFFNKIRYNQEKSKSDGNKKTAKKTYKIAKQLKEQKLKDKLLAIITKKYLENKIFKKSDINKFQIQTNITKALQENLKIKPFKDIDKLLIFDTKDYHKILKVLNDKKLKNILTFYLEGKTEIKYVDKDKYEEKSKEFKNAKENDTEVKRKIYDLQDAFQKIEWEQIQIINLVLQLENKILDELSNEKQEELKNINNFNIETIELLKKWNIDIKEDDLANIPDAIKNCDTVKKDIHELRHTDLSENKKLFFSIIFYYRKKAFHNETPMAGTFQHGIKLLDNHLN